MCEPASLTSTTLAYMSLATTAVSTVAGVAGSVAQTNQQNKRSAENSRAAIDSYILKTAQVGKRIRQEQEATVETKEDTRSKTRKAKGAARTAAAAGNVEGVSVDRLINDYERSAAVMDFRTDKNQRLRTESLMEGNEELEAEAVNRINSVPMIGGEKIFGSIISGATDLTQTYLSVEDDIFDTTEPEE